MFVYDSDQQSFADLELMTTRIITEKEVDEVFDWPQEIIVITATVVAVYTSATRKLE